MLLFQIIVVYPVLLAFASAAPSYKSSAPASDVAPTNPSSPSSNCAYPPLFLLSFANSTTRYDNRLATIFYNQPTNDYLWNTSSFSQPAVIHTLDRNTGALHAIIPPDLSGNRAATLLANVFSFEPYSPVLFNPVDAVPEGRTLLACRVGGSKGELLCEGPEYKKFFQVGGDSFGIFDFVFIARDKRMAGMGPPQPLSVRVVGSRGCSGQVQ